MPPGRRRRAGFEIGEKIERASEVGGEHGCSAGALFVKLGGLGLAAHVANSVGLREFLAERKVGGLGGAGLELADGEPVV